VTTIQC